MPDIDINFPYTATQLSDAVNLVPNNYGLLNDLNLFPSRGAISTIIEVKREGGTIRVLPAKERGSPGTLGDRASAASIFIKAPHFPSLDLITATDLQDMQTVIARSRRPVTLDDEVAKRLRTIRNKHAITREWIRMGALKGLITDGNGEVLLDLFNTFGIVKKSVDFTLGTAGTDIIEKCTEVRQHIDENLKGETMTRVEVLVSSSFFNKFTQHPKVEKYWLNFAKAQEIAQGNMLKVGSHTGRVFDFQQIVFREYIGKAPIGENQTATPFVTAGYGHAFPAGTMDTFETWDAPPDDIRAVNQVGDEIWISPVLLDHGAGVELKSQSNPLAIVKRPEILVELTTSN